MPTQRAAASRWTGSGSDQLWSDAANWSAGAPGAGMVARFARPGVQVALDAAAATEIGQVSVLGGSVSIAGGALRWKAPPYEHGLFSAVGLQIDGGGALSVAPRAALLGAHTVALGDLSAATLNVAGVLVDSQVYAGLGGPVAIAVAGSGAQWLTTGADQSFMLGGAAPATLTVSGGATVGDGAAWGQTGASSTMTIGGVRAGAAVTVTDPGSLLRFQIIDVGGQYQGTLTIAAGAHVDDFGGDVGQSGDGTVEVNGAGSVWDNVNGLFVHGAAPQGAVSIADHGTVRFGAYGLQLEGSLTLDPTARLAGAQIVMGGGSVSAQAGPDGAGGTVTLSQAVALGYNPVLGSGNAGNFVGSAGGVTLVLQGAVAPQGDSYDPLAIGGGDVVLANADNGDFGVSLYGGVLEVAQAGASGSGGITFLDGAGTTLRLDQTGALADPVAQFGVTAQDVIDAHAIAFGGDSALSWRAEGAKGGVLQVSGGGQSLSITLEGRYAAGGFHAAADGQGGTAISYG